VIGVFVVAVAGGSSALGLADLRPSDAAARIDDARAGRRGPVGDTGVDMALSSGVLGAFETEKPVTDTLCLVGFVVGEGGDGGNSGIVGEVARGDEGDTLLKLPPDPTLECELELGTAR